MTLHTLNNPPSIVYYYSGHKIENIKEAETYSLPTDSMTLIRAEVIKEIKGMRHFRKKLKHQFPDLLVHAKP